MKFAYVLPNFLASFRASFKQIYISPSFFEMGKLKISVAFVLSRYTVFNNFIRAAEADMTESEYFFPKAASFMRWKGMRGIRARVSFVTVKFMFDADDSHLSFFSFLMHFKSFRFLPRSEASFFKKDFPAKIHALLAEIPLIKGATGEARGGI